MPRHRDTLVPEATRVEEVKAVVVGLATDCSEAALKALETSARQRPESAGPVETERGRELKGGRGGLVGY